MTDQTDQAQPLQYRPYNQLRTRSRHQNLRQILAIQPHPRTVGIGGCVEALRLPATYEVPRQALTVGVPAKGLAQRVGGMLRLGRNLASFRAGELGEGQPT